jgi:hypothetical protein
MKKIFGFILVILIFSNCVLTAQWVQTNGPNSKTFCLTVKGKNLFAGTDSGVCLSTNNGTNWKTLNNGLNFYYYEYGYNFPPQRSTFHTIAYLDTNLFVGSWGCGVFLSTNNGTSWSAVNDGLADLDGKAFVTSLVVSKSNADGTNLFAGTFGGVYLSTNNGTNWIRLGDNVFEPLIISDTNLFAGGYFGVCISINNGKNWTAINNGLPVQSGVTAFTVSPNGIGGLNLFAAFGWDGVYLSTNNGSKWIEANNGIMYNNVLCLTSFGTNIFAGTNNGVFLTTNNGKNWISENSGLITYQDYVIQALVVLDSLLFAGTPNSVLRRPISEMVSSILNPELPSQFILNQNYPNPFNPTTTINYSVPKSGIVKIKVYDLLGREVATIVNENKPAGNYNIEFNASKLTSGIYFYRMEAGSFSQTKKLLLLK